MSLKSKINAAKESGTTPITYKQGGLMFQLTKLKWWQPETMPPPTVAQASLLIEACLNFIKTGEGGTELIEGIQIWFPDFDNLSDIRIRYASKGKKKDDQASEAQPEPQPKPAPETKQESTSKSGYPGGVRGKKNSAPKDQPMPEPIPAKEPEPEPLPEPATKPKPKKEAKPVKGTAELEALIGAGIKNIWMVGPAGCGKTTICMEVGELAGIPVTIIPCGAGTSATTFLGYKYPEREGTPFVHAFAQEGIIVLDEFTSLEAQVAQIVNGALANDELTSTIGTFRRHEKCVIIATSNTFGNGADRMYVSNNQLDASTIDRFAGGIVEIDYSKEYERQYDNEVVQYVWKMRDAIKANGLRKVASTRSIISGCKLKAGGLNWKSALIQNWTKDEKALL
jgi:hypothetical protein